MPCIRIGSGFICGPKVYRFKGYYFEWHSYCGPSPLNKNGELSKKIPKGFWNMIDEFQSLSLEEKENHREL